MFKKSVLASSLMLAALSASAADYYVVTPVKGRTQNTASITVSLSQSSLPSGQVGTAYSYDFKQNLQVIGDASYTDYGVSWTVRAGTLPAGLSLNASTGVLSGTPTAGGPSSFTIGATYKTKNGDRAYDLVVSQPVTATGGTITYNGNYVVHTFTSNGTFQLTAPSGVTANILVVGGGGGGGYDGGGGGGGGAVVYQSNYTITAGAYNVIVGSGGAATSATGGAIGAAALGKQGSESSFGSITAAGGGAGGGKAGVGATGASGGGTGHTGGATGGSATAGNAGGGASSTSGGGGGGAGSAGALGATSAGNGGNGVVVVMPGVATATYGCGGGGGTYTTNSYGLACGGSVSSFGTGGNPSNAPRAGLANSGSGGGGGGNTSSGTGQGAAGGSGIVIITYQKTI